VKSQPAGTLIIIGGHEDKSERGERSILKAVSDRASAGKGRLVITTVATQLPEELAQEYVQVFGRLGVKNVDVVDIRSREDAYAEAAIDKVKEAAVVFFTGGDQLRIASQLGGTPVCRCLQHIFRNGATIVGTSAGAAAMPASRRSPS